MMSTSFTRVLQPAAPAPTAPPDVVFHDIQYEINAPSRRVIFRRTAVPPSKPVLCGVSGHAARSQLLAILGPSGSGKTTLLNVLAARTPHPPSRGTILFNGERPTPRLKRDIGYITQHDVFLEQLTVRQTLDFTAAIRPPRPQNAENPTSASTASATDSAAARKTRVDSVLRSLALCKCENTNIGDPALGAGGLSGGERRRLSIASELLHEPRVLLADECTSGLDASTALSVITSLRDVCRTGRTVIVTVHQPSSQMFAIFDNVLVLAAGRVAYFGKPARLTAYFGSVGWPFPAGGCNPADYVLELVNNDQQVDDGGLSVQESILHAWSCSPLNEAEEYSTTGTDDLSVSNIEKAVPVFLHQSSEGDVHTPDPSNDVCIPVSTPDRSTSGSPLAKTESPYPTTYAGRIARAFSKRALGLTGRHSEDDLPEKYPTSWWQQVGALSRRAIQQKKGLLIQPTALLQVALLTTLVLLVWFRMRLHESTIEDRLGACLQITITWSFSGVIGAITAFPSEKRVLSKDRASGTYRLSAYYFAKSMVCSIFLPLYLSLVLCATYQIPYLNMELTGLRPFGEYPLQVEIPADALFPFAFMCIVHYTIGLNSDIRAFLQMLCIVVLNAIVAQSVGLFFSALFMDVRQALVIGQTWVLMSLTLTGYTVDPNNIPAYLKPLRALSFLRYAYEGMVRTEMSFGRTIPCEDDGPRTIYSAEGQCPIGKGGLLRAAQISEAMPIWGTVLVQVAFIIVTRFLAYLALKILHKSHKPTLRSWRNNSTS